MSSASAWSDVGTAAASFSCRWGGSAIEFGRGSRKRLADVVADMHRPFGVVASPSQVRSGTVDEVVAALAPHVVGTFVGTRVHAPREVCDEAAAALEGSASLVVVGGGAALSVAKVVAVALDLPIMVLTTTFSGSEMTGLYGVTEQGQKTVSWDARALPVCVVYDPELSETLPLEAARASAVNCLAHALEAAWSPASSPVAAPIAAECVRALGRGVRALDGGGVPAAADDLLMAGWLGGMTLATGRMGVHHATCHVLGGMFGVSHGLLNAIVLPAAMRFNGGPASAIQRTLVELLGEGADEREPWRVVAELIGQWQLPTRLHHVGIHLDDSDATANAIAASGAAQTNPRPVTPSAVREMLDEIR